MRSDEGKRRKALGEIVARARLRLGLSKDDAAGMVGMSAVTWTRVETGQTVRALSYSGVERVLGWAAGACQDYLRDGVEPAQAEAPASLDAVERFVLDNVPPKHQAAVLAMLRGVMAEDQPTKGDRKIG